MKMHKLPAVIKLDFTWGGQGVSIVYHEEEARRVVGSMRTRPPVSKTLLRALLDRDPSFVPDYLRTPPRTVIVQEFISGFPANRAVACWRGKVLAGISVLALETQHSTGPATVVQVIENEEMSAVAVRLVRRLGLSGLWGLDFVLEASSGAAYLIEMNPRATPISHLALEGGSSLAAAIYAQLAGISARERSASRSQEIIALFPGEMNRDPSSPYLRSEYEDIPWGEPEFVRECLRKPWSERGVLAQMWSRIRRTAASDSDLSFVDTDLGTIAPSDG
ncbi:MAG: ATP-grasp domain-containing protein [Burkholderiaceae bacterium]|jgi:hypothetical protein